MDIITHTLGGVAIGTVCAAFSKKGWGEKTSLLCLGGVGGALPDVDAVSLWKYFDSTIGRFFHLQHTGKEIYTDNLWYSHHAFFHSILGGLLFTFLLGFTVYLLRIKSSKSYFRAISSNILLLFGFFSAFLLHLLCDMPTPSGSWGGVQLFFPLKMYVGGAGKIWWWNNYDIFLITISVILLNIIFLFFRAFKQYVTVTIFILGLILSLHQIESRIVNFNDLQYKTNYGASEKESKEIQKAILNKKLYISVAYFDNNIQISF